MFDKATRLKLRFDTTRGQLTTEDLWDLPLTSKKGDGFDLDTVAKALNKQIRESETESFVNAPTFGSEETELRFNVVKAVIEYKLAAAAEEATRKDRKARRERLQEIIAQKETEKLLGSDLDALKAELAAI